MTVQIQNAFKICFLFYSLASSLRITGLTARNLFALERNFFACHFAPYLKYSDPTNLINLAKLIRCETLNFSRPWARMACKELNLNRVNELYNIFRQDIPIEERLEHQKAWVRDAILSIECIASNEMLIQTFLRPKASYPPYLLSQTASYTITNLPLSITWTYFQRLNQNPSEWISDCWCKKLNESIVMSFFEVAERFISADCYEMTSRKGRQLMLTKPVMAPDYSNNWVLTTLRLLQTRAVGPNELKYIKTQAKRDLTCLEPLVNCILSSHMKYQNCESLIYNMLLADRYKDDTFVCFELLLLYIQKTATRLSERMVQIAQDLIDGFPAGNGERNYTRDQIESISNEKYKIIPFYSVRLIKRLSMRQKNWNQVNASLLLPRHEKIWDALEEVDCRLIPSKERYKRMLRETRIQVTRNPRSLSEITPLTSNLWFQNIQECSSIADYLLNYPTVYEQALLSYMERSNYLPHFENLIQSIMYKLCTSTKIEMFMKGKNSPLSPPFLFKPSSSPVWHIYLKMYFHGLAYAVRHCTPICSECRKFNGTQFVEILAKLPYRIPLEILMPLTNWGFSLEELIDDIIQWE